MHKHKIQHFFLFFEKTLLDVPSIRNFVKLGLGHTFSVDKLGEKHLVNPVSELPTKLFSQKNEHRHHLRKFSRSSRLQEDQDRSLGFLPLTHSPDIMWEWPVHVAWSSSWLIPKLNTKKRIDNP